MSADDFFDRLERHRPNKKPDETGVPSAGADAGAKPNTASLRKQFAESLLGNESLTDGLDDDAANELIDWGMEIADQVAERAGRSSSEQTMAVIDEGLDAAERLLRQARDLAVSEPSQADRAVILEQMTAEAKVVYGPSRRKPKQPADRTAGESEPAPRQPGTQAERIIQVRRMVETSQAGRRPTAPDETDLNG